MPPSSAFFVYFSFFLFFFISKAGCKITSTPTAPTPTLMRKNSKRTQISMLIRVHAIQVALLCGLHFEITA